MSYVLNFFWPSTVYLHKGNYYINRAWFHNKLTDHFDVCLFAKVERKKEIDLQRYQKLTEKMTVIDFFDATDSIHFVKNYSKYKQKILQKADKDSEMFFVMYPYKKTSIYLAYILSDFDLTIWVKSDYVGLFTVYDGPFIKSKLKKGIKPILSHVYPKITNYIFEDNVVFYTGDIIYDKQNHQSQYGITSLSPLNQDQSRITKSLNKRIIFIGDDGNQKGLKYLLESLLRIDEDIELSILGMDELNRYSNYEEKLNIHIHGTVYDNKLFYDILSDHDLLVMPSICERQGKVQIEAMSTGVVPICSDSGGTYTTVDHLYNGMLFEEKNVNELVGCIDRIYSSESLYQTLQKNGLEYTDKLDLTSQVEKMSTIMKHHYDKK